MAKLDKSRIKEKKQRATARKPRAAAHSRDVQTARPETTIIETLTLSPHAYCEIPAHFFDAASKLAKRCKPILSVDSWDGRTVLAVGSRIK